MCFQHLNALSISVRNKPYEQFQRKYYLQNARV